MRLPATAPTLSDGLDLVLRGHRNDDLPGIVEQCRDAESQRWTTVPVPYQQSDAERFLAHVAEGWSSGTVAAFAIEYRNRFAGTIDLHLAEAAWAEIGFGLARWARGHHVMRRAVMIVLDWSFEELGLAGVCWRTYVGNDASRHVAEACGFRVEGTVRGLCVQRGARVDAWIGTILRSDRRDIGEQIIRSQA